MTWIFKKTHSFVGVSKWASLYVPEPYLEFFEQGGSADIVSLIL